MAFVADTTNTTTTGKALITYTVIAVVGFLIWKKIR